MILFPRLMRADDDDYAPIDYSYVPSVSEGRRREQQQKMHRGEAASGPIVRHRAEPDADRDLVEYGVRPVASAQPVPGRDTVMRRLPTMADGPAPARSIAYPANDGIPDDPFHPPAETQQPRRRRTERAPQPAPQQRPAAPAQPVGAGSRTAMPQHHAPVMTAEDGSQFEAPAAPDIPDWLRVAQQNNMPFKQRPQGPSVFAAPRHEEAPAVDALGRPLHRRPQPAPQASPYETAGYPQQLVEAQREWEREQAAQPMRRRHGAQYAVKPQTPYPQRPKEAPAVQMSSAFYQQPIAMDAAPQPAPVMQRGYDRPAQMEPDSGWHVETDEDDVVPRELPAWMTKIPWLPIAAFAVILAAVVFWVMGSNYEKETALVLSARQAAEAAVAESHPLKYEELIAQKAQKYNLSPAFVAAIMLNESSFRPDATASSTGAKGLMQLVDDTSEWVHGKLAWPEPYNPQDLYDPEINAEFGCWYLNYLSAEFRGDPVLVAAAYHAGQNNVQNWLNTSSYSPDGRTLSIDKIPFDDTRRYVTRVMNNFAAYKRLYYGG